MTLKPLFTDHGIPLAVMGMLVVFAALVFVSVFIAFLPRIMEAYGRWFPDAESLQRAESAKPDELSDETIAVIAAAAMHVVGRAHRIVHIQRGVPSGEGWALEGRRQHHASHSPPSKK